jgi:hypothetical protein
LLVCLFASLFDYSNISLFVYFFVYFSLFLLILSFCVFRIALQMSGATVRVTETINRSTKDYLSLDKIPPNHYYCANVKASPIRF